MTNFKDKVIYQIYPKSFRDTNGDGVGDIKGIIEKIDYLSELGVDYLWLTPIFQSPLNDNGYDVSNYYQIDPVFGTMEDVEELIAVAKEKGIGIMFDMVFNHTSTEHEWFQKAIHGDTHYQKYYYFVDGDPNQPPTNWQSKFGGPAWQYVDSIQKWYLHLFDVSQADLNWENPEVRNELKKVIKFWKDKGIAGFRFDVVNLISKPSILEDDEMGDGRRFYTDGPKVHQFIKELVKDTGIEELVTVGEMSSTTLEHCIRYTNPKEKELSMCFNFHHLKVDYKDGDKWQLMSPDLDELRNIFATWQVGMEQGNGWNAVFWCNHDQPRIVSRLGSETKYRKESAKMLATLIHLMRGTPYIYQGEEIGMTNAHYKSIDQYDDVESLNNYQILLEQGKTKEQALEVLAARSRDNARSPMQWSAQEFAGFSEKAAWLALADNYLEINVEKDYKAEDSVYKYYQKLIELRKKMKIISEGGIQFFEYQIPEIIGYQRSLNHEKLVVINNMSNQEQEISVQKEWWDYQIILSNYSRNNISDQLILKPYESLVLYNGKLNKE